MTTLTLRLEAYARDGKAAISQAQALADERQHAEVEPLHLLYRMIERDRTAQDVIARAGVDPSDVLVEAEAWLRRLVKLPGAVAYLSPRMLELLGRAEAEASREGGAQVSSKHLLLACAQETSGAVPHVFKQCGLNAPLLRAVAASTPTSGAVLSGAVASGAPSFGASSLRPSATDPLEKYGRDLTRLAAQGALDPAVGRDKELRRVQEILARRRDHNPLLVGEPGIGRSTIVEALAQRIARGDVPAMLADKRVIRIDVGALSAGSKLRSEIDERARQLLSAVRDAGGAVIVFLPDLGAFLGDKSALLDAFTSAFSGGDIHGIAVATPDDLKRAEGAALVRHFAPIAVEPPTVDEAIAVLRGVAPRYEAAHGITLSDPALISAVRLAKRYVRGGQLPRTAIDLIDEAAAAVRVAIEGVPPELDALERKAERIAVERKSLEDESDGSSVASRDRLDAEEREARAQAAEMREMWSAAVGKLGEVRRVRQELAAAEREEAQAKANGDDKRASELHTGTIPLLRKQLDTALALTPSSAPVTARDVVQPEDIARVVSTWTGVPVAKMMEGESDKLLRMEERLGDRVVGQPRALEAVAKAVRRGRVGLRDPKRPIGSFLFLGPTGVGKTELAKALAEFLFDDELSMTRLDMSEFMEKHTVARLLGAPPGYVDSEEGGFLTEAVRRKPYSVVLFDEVEKAHADVFNILLQVLDDGRLTDSRGRIAHFADTVIILTSNIGGRAILEHEGDDASLRDTIQQELRAHFRPEFLNRIDDIVLFDRLTKENLRGVLEIQLRALASLLRERGIGLEVSDAAKDLLVDLGYEPAFGARPLRRVIVKHLQDPLAEAILRGGYEPGTTVVVGVRDRACSFDQRLPE